MMVGEDGVFATCRPAIKDLLQYEPSELVGRRSTDFVHPEDLDRDDLLGGCDFQSGPGTATWSSG